MEVGSLPFLPPNRVPPMRRSSVLVIGLLLIQAAPDGLLAQAGPGQPGTSAPLRVFLDCQSGCDDAFIRTELTWVDYVRDRGDADLHVLVTSQATGSGGREYHLRFIGLRSLQGQDLERTFTTPAAATGDQIRTRLVEVLGVGLVRFVAGRPEAEHLRVSVARPPGEAPGAAPAHDPWNRWVFTVGGNGFLNGESRSRANSLSGFVRARRITDAWKLDLSVSGSRSDNTFTLSDGEEFTSKVRSYSGGFLLGRSVGDRMAAGIRMTGRNSTRNNEDLVLRPMAVVEYSLFPYRESTRRLVTLEYGIGGYAANYTEETIFGETSEVLARHYLSLAVDLRQPWGSLGLGANVQSYLRDFGQNRVGLYTSMNVRIIRGLTFNAFADYGRPRDQLSLPRGEASDEEVLLRLRQLETNYTYFVNFGLQYSFGSLFSAVVNPRLRGADPASGGGAIFF